MSSKFIILANGEINDPASLATRLEQWSPAIVVAADGGLRHAERLGLNVDVLIGDLDSVKEERIKQANPAISIQKFPQAKDGTDLELALIYAADSGAETIAVIGTFGGRLDMSLANILLLTLPQLSMVQVEAWVGQQTAWIIRPPGADITGIPGDTVSLLPLFEDVTGISSTNLVYTLNESTLKAGEVRGVSNVLTNTSAHIQLETGTLLIVHTPGHA